MIKNFFIIILVTLSFSVALFEKQIFPFFKMKTYDKEIFGFEKDFGPRWVPFFPFSSMPMYSESYDPAYVTQLEILGVTSQGEEIVLPIWRYFFPLWPEALREIFINHRLNEMPTKHFFTLFFKLYEHRRTAKAYYEDVPKLDKIEVYALTWDLESWIKMRKMAPSLLVEYDWRKSKLNPQKRSVLAIISADEVQN